MIRELLEGWKEHRLIRDEAGETFCSVRYRSSLSLDLLSFIYINYADDDLDFFSYYIPWKMEYTIEDPKYFDPDYPYYAGQIPQIYRMVKAVQEGEMPGFVLRDYDECYADYFTITVDGKGAELTDKCYCGIPDGPRVYNACCSLQQLIDMFDLYRESVKELLGYDIMEYYREYYKDVLPKPGTPYPVYNMSVMSVDDDLDSL